MHTPNNFEALYQCRIEPTGEIIYKAPDVRVPHTPLTLMEKILMEKEREIAIRMPESEYNKFLQNWNQYMDIMLTINKHPHLRDEYHRLLVVINMMK